MGTILEETIILVKERKEWKCGKGASLLEISEAQSELNIKFPPDYIQFLFKVGWCTMEDLEIFGIGIDVPFHLNLINLTHSERKQAQPKLPFFLIPLSNDGWGNLYCLDTRNIKIGECPVILFNHEVQCNQRTQSIASSFSEYLEVRVKRA